MIKKSSCIFSKSITYSFSRVNVDYVHISKETFWRTQDFLKLRNVALGNLNLKGEMS